MPGLLTTVMRLTARLFYFHFYTTQEYSARSEHGWVGWSHTLDLTAPSSIYPNEWRCTEYGALASSFLALRSLCLLPSRDTSHFCGTWVRCCPFNVVGQLYGDRAKKTVYMYYCPFTGASYICTSNTPSRRKPRHINTKRQCCLPLRHLPSHPARHRRHPDEAAPSLRDRLPHLRRRAGFPVSEASACLGILIGTIHQQPALRGPA